MPSRFIVQPNGLLARFSTVVDDFTHMDMTEEDVARVVMEEYGEAARRDAEAAIKRAVAEPGRWVDAITTARLVHGEDIASERMRDGERNVNNMGITYLATQVPGQFSVPKGENDSSSMPTLTGDNCVVSVEDIQSGVAPVLPDKACVAKSVIPNNIRGPR